MNLARSIGKSFSMWRAQSGCSPTFHCKINNHWICSLCSGFYFQTMLIVCRSVLPCNESLPKGEIRKAVTCFLLPDSAMPFLMPFSLFFFVFFFPVMSSSLLFIPITSFSLAEWDNYLFSIILSLHFVSFGGTSSQKTVNWTHNSEQKAACKVGEWEF